MLSQITGCHIFRYASQLVCAYILHMLGSNDLCKCSVPIQLLARFHHCSLNVIWLFNPALKSYPFGELQSNKYSAESDLSVANRQNTNKPKPNHSSDRNFLIPTFISTIYIYVYIVSVLCFLEPIFLQWRLWLLSKIEGTFSVNCFCSYQMSLDSFQHLITHKSCFLPHMFLHPLIMGN